MRIFVWRHILIIGLVTLLFLRSMTTRRDNPDGALWRLAVEGFNRVLVDDFCKLSVDGGLDSSTSKPARTRIWKEVADLYEIFLVGYCGRALRSDSLSTVVGKADESLEMTTLDILGDKILKSPVDAPNDVMFLLIKLYMLLVMPFMQKNNYNSHIFPKLFLRFFLH